MTLCITFVFQMILLLKEYLNSEDIEEVSQLKMCILCFVNPVRQMAIFNV